MPISNQARKRMRSDEKKSFRNQIILSKLKTLKKATLQMTNKEEVKEQIKAISKQYDKATSKGVIPKGRADRMKSRLTKKLQKLS